MYALFRKITAVICIIALLAALTACGEETPFPPVSPADVPTATDAPEEPLPVVGQPADEPLDWAYSVGEIANASFEAGEEGWVLSGDAAVGADASFIGAAGLTLGSAGSYSASAAQYISDLEPGYYYLEVYTLNEGNQNYCYAYACGSGQGECMTALPRTVTEGGWIKVTVRGIEVGEDGLLEIGARAAGEGQYAHFDNFVILRESDQITRYESLFGGAISWLDWVEDLGGRYYRADGSEADALQIMAENGCNFVRLELYNNPGDYINPEGDAFPAGYKDADAIFDLAMRAHQKGMKIQLSFMYSDYWGNEAIPSDWLGKIEGVSSDSEKNAILTECLYDFTKGFMQRLAEAGIYPEYVSLGNEMSGGILLPYGCTYTTDTAMSGFCSFMDAGWRAVKEVSPDTQIVLHIACNADDMFWESGVGTGRWFFGLCEQYGVKYDIIGTSFYPFWAQTDSQYALKRALDTGDFVEWADMMVECFDKDILVMESGINWGTPGQLANNGAYEGIYPYTPAGQRDFMYELINAIKSVRDGRCIGDLYWDPVLVRQPGVGWAVRPATSTSRPNCVETTTFFDYDHRALPVLAAYRYNLSGEENAVIFGKITHSDGTPAANTAVSISFGGTNHTVVTDGYGDYYIRVAPAGGVLAVNGSPCAQPDLYSGDRVELDIILE